MSDVDKRPECKICFKRFSRTANLTKHLRIHNDDKPFSCEVCQKRFTNASNLIRHCMTHTGQRNYQCTMCTMKFTDPSNLRRHFLMHTKPKSFQCEVCFKNFSSISNLQTHQRIHTGDKPYACDVCTRSFTQSYDLKLHRYVHTGERPFKCDYCPKNYAHPSNLRKHEASHYPELTEGRTPRRRGPKTAQPSEDDEILAVRDIYNLFDAEDVTNKEETSLSEFQNSNSTDEVTFSAVNETIRDDKNAEDNLSDKMYECEICKKGFSTLSNLQFHAQKHRPKKPYECNVCGRCFAQLYDLRLHRFVHTGERPFQCDSCSKCYSHPSNLRKHRKSHSSEKRQDGRKRRRTNNAKSKCKTNDVCDTLSNYDDDKTDTESDVANELDNYAGKEAENCAIFNNISENSKATHINEDIISNLVYNIIDIIVHNENSFT